MNQQPQPTSLYPVERGDELSLIELWKVMVEYKLLIVVFVTLTTLSALYYTTTLPTIYKVEVLMLPASNSSPGAVSGGLTGMAGMAGISLLRNSVGAKGEQALARLKTRSFLINHIKGENLKHILLSDQWDESEGVWINENPSDREASELLLNMIATSMDPNDKAGLVIFTLEWKSPNIANIANIANNLVDNMNRNAKQRAIVEAKKSISFLEKELEQTSVINSQTILYSMIEQQLQKIMLAKISDEFVFKVIDPAITPEQHEPKPILLIILSGIFIGLFFGTAIATTLKHLRGGVHNIISDHTEK